MKFFREARLRKSTSEKLKNFIEPVFDRLQRAVVNRILVDSGVCSFFFINHRPKSQGRLMIQKPKFKTLLFQTTPVWTVLFTDTNFFTLKYYYFYDLIICLMLLKIVCSSCHSKTEKVVHQNIDLSTSSQAQYYHHFVQNKMTDTIIS